MTKIYCVKCRVFTNTTSEKLVTTTNERNRLTGICDKCGSKKGMFVSEKKKFHKKTNEEIEEAREKRRDRSAKKKALRIGQKILEASKAKE